MPSSRSIVFLSSICLLLTACQASGSGEPGVGEASAHRSSSNRLAGETSPYLLLHKNNPVDWYPWGEEALAKARREDKPIFLSVGYSTCYWCHVMERESFSDPAIASLLNQRFVPIKVDREERPDLDEIYMTATQLFTRRGGWPNSVFLTPDLKPFFAGTYFPPDDRDGRPGFASLLDSLSNAWQEQRPEVDQQAERLAQLMGRVLEETAAPAADVPAADLALRAAESLSQSFDAEWGGFGPAPKFPSPSNLFLLLELIDELDGAEVMLSTTLDRMARGGLYDQVGGGFHRYSTDRQWRVPHFEKMLYDNALLLEVYARWHQRTGDPEAARIAHETANFLARDLTSDEGALLSAIDAETDTEEGAYYVWSRAELDRVLGPEQASWLAPILGFDVEPSFEGGRHVLYLPESLAKRAAALGFGRASLLEQLEPMRRRLLAARYERERPLVDDKILTDWNGMGIAALATAGQLLEAPRYVAQAERAASFVLAHLRPESGPLQHSWRQGTAKIDAYLSDYAFLVRGLLALYRATEAERWLTAARELSEEQIDRLADPQGGFYLAAENSDLLYRSKDISDGAIPAANAVAVSNLLHLTELSGEPRWRQLAAASLRAFEPRFARSPASARTLALATWRYHLRAPRSAMAKLTAEAKKVVKTTLELGPQRLTDQKEATEAAFEGGRPFTLRFEIADGWHVNANPASDELLIATSIEAPGGRLENVVYPPGRLIRPAFAEGEIAAYEGLFEVTGTVFEGATLSVVFQACDDQRCLPPVRRDLALD